MHPVRCLLLFPCFLGLLVIAPIAAHAIEFQIAMSQAKVTRESTSSNEYSEPTAVMPAIAVGVKIAPSILLFLQADTINYETTIKDKATGIELAKAKVKSTSFSAVVVPRFERFDIRLGYGVVQETGSLDFSSEYLNALGAIGITNFKTKVDPAQGTQVLYGIDFRLTPNFSIGVEQREIKTDIRLTDTYDDVGTPTKRTFDDDNNHSITMVRLALNF